MSKQTKRNAEFLSSFDEEETAIENEAASTSAKSDRRVPAINVVGALQQGELSQARARIDELTKQLSESDRIVSIDPKLVTATRFRDRHDRGFDDAAYGELREQIKHAGKNIQPVLVRPASEENLARGYKYELIWGHRRHRAVSEENLLLRAVVAENVDDRSLVLLMTSENSNRSGLSAYEEARKYQLWLDEGLYESMADIAEAVGVNKSTISRICSINNLPTQVTYRLADPRLINPFWADKVQKAWDADPDEARARLDAIKGDKLSLKQVEIAVVNPDSNGKRSFNSGNHTVFKTAGKTDANGTRYKTLELVEPLDEEQAQKLAAFITTLRTKA